MPDGGHVVLDVASGTYLRLDGAAGEIVALATQCTTEAEVADRLVERHGVAPARAAADVHDVLGTLRGLPRARGRRGRRPSGRAIIRRVGEWWVLPTDLRRSVAALALVQVGIELALRTTDLAAVAGRLGVPLAGGDGADGANGTADARRGGSAPSHDEQRRLQAAAWLLNRWPLPATCLRRALLAGWVLRRHQPVLHLGLAPDGVTAHAWVEAGGVAYDPGDTVDVFRPLGDT